MNNREEAIRLSSKIGEKIDVNEGVLTLIFFDETQKTVRLLCKNSTLTIESFTCFLTTFIDDKTNTTIFDIYQIKDVV